MFCKLLTIPGSSLWAVVNNAGIGYPGPIEWMTVEEMKRVVNINLWGMVSVCKTFLPLLKKTKGRIVNVASTSGRLASPVAAAYCISKFGVEAFSDSLRNEMRHFRVTVHVIEPGMFKTNITRLEKNCWYLQRLWENLDTDTKECYGVEYYEQGLVTLNNVLVVKPSLILSLRPPPPRKQFHFFLTNCGTEGSSHIRYNRPIAGGGAGGLNPPQNFWKCKKQCVKNK